MTASDCENCPLRDQRSQVYSTVPARAKFAIVGEAPGPQEERQGRPFVGESGDLLDRVLYRFGINRSEAVVTNALLCRPWRPLSDAEWSQALTACGKRLQSELPVRHVLVVGARALQSLDPKRRGGILAWSGGYIEHDRRVLVPTMHPAFIMRSPAYTPIFWMYVRNFALALRGDKPKPIRAVLRPGRAALTALRSFRTAARTSWDIENLGDDPYANKIMSIAVTTEDLAVSLPFDAYDTRKYGTVRGLLEYPDGPALLALLRELWQNSTPKTFQNGQHDIAGLSPEHRLGKCGNFADDTFIADLALVPGVKHDLGALYAREVLDRRYKQEFGAGAGDSKGAAKFAHRPQRTLRAYNAHDGIAAAIIQRRQARNLDETPGARTAYELYMNLTREAAIPMRERGLEIDLDARAELRTEVTARIEEARKDVLAVTANCDLPEFNPRSFPQCAELFYKRLGLTPTHFSEDTGEPSTDEDALTEILRGTHEIARAVAQALLKFRKYDKLLSTYIDGLPIEGHPARVRSTWLVGGARTARWASQNPNCLSADTEVLTPHGWRRFDEWWQAPTEVAQWDNGVVSFVTPTNKIKQRGALINVRNNATDVAMTPDHRCLVETRRGVRTVVAGASIPSDHKQFHAGSYAWQGTLDMTPDTLAFVVAFQADGSYHAYGGLDFTFTKRRKIQRLRALLDKLHARYRVYVSGARTRFYIPKQPLVDVVRQYLGAQKLFGAWLLEMSADCAKRFDEEVWLWDGSASRRSQYASKHKINADWVQTVLALLGQRANVRRYLSPRGSESWQVDVVRQNYSWTTNLQTLELDAGDVYCVEVPSGFILTRRNGKPWVTGNCQNIPKGMRRMFRARPGMWFVEADFSQLELRILAQLCNAKKLIEAYREKRDVHQMNADFLYDWAHPGQPANDKERDFAKRFVYGLGYGGDDQTLWEALVVDSPGVTIELIAKLRAAYFGLHTEILPWQDRLFADAKANGYVEMPLSGRRIKNWGRPERTEIVNYPVQGTAADLINGPTLKIVRQIDWKNTALVLQVHDALYLESNDPEKAADLLRSNLTQHIVLNGVEMTYPVDVKIGRNWGPYHDRSKCKCAKQPCQAPNNLEGMKKHD